MKKLPSTKEIIKLLETKTPSQIARTFSVSRQAIDWRLKHVNDEEKRLWRRQLIREAFKAGVKPKTIAEKFGVHITTVYKYCRDLPKNFKLKLPGCPKCLENPYARKYCKKCYQRWLQQQP